MNKKLLFFVFTLICVSISAFSSIKKKVFYLQGLELNNIEALAQSETDCNNNDDKNNGDCQKKTDGTGYVCVEGMFFDDCY